MGCQLFLHQYLPALAALFRASPSSISSSLRTVRVCASRSLVIDVITISKFQHYSSLAYGIPWTQNKSNTSIFAPLLLSSATSAVTVDGEDGSRAPVVMDGSIVPVAEAVPMNSVGFGIAEPCKDIFAGDPARGIHQLE
ncbi:hypothetical protein FIBSPDRAFT_1052425 [Athelia psychrophila]|uniref:Uncharacterized protein n=1 Tax=Athelia psychrophila TaxID=1759441 RepID=A0A165XB45_9AGAM|nr:hypothetical protein FIBSPDRAFT_1052425 [Fibularhizoctonia sp. CBS 109695]